MSEDQLTAIGKALGHELNLLYQKGKYLTTQGWKDEKQLAEMTLEIIEGIKSKK